MMDVPQLLGVLVLVVGVPLNLIVAVLLWRAVRARPSLRVLRERLVAEVAVLLTVIVFGLIFLNNDTTAPPLPVDLTKLITRSVMLFVAIVPALYWLRLFRR